MVKKILILIPLACIAGCTGQTKLREAELATLLGLYPGRYNNVGQVEDDVRAGREPHAALELNIVPVYAPRAGEHVFYFQESAADDPRRIFSQRLVSFAVVKDGGIVQSLWTLAEPVRWRDAHLNTDLFKGLMPQDFGPMRGCDLVWTAKEGGFTATNEAGSCRVSSSAGTVRMDLRAELSANELAISDQSYDLSGRLVQGSAGDPYFRFVRR